MARALLPLPTGMSKIEYRCCIIPNMQRQCTWPPVGSLSVEFAGALQKAGANMEPNNYMICNLHAEALAVYLIDPN